MFELAGGVNGVINIYRRTNVEIFLSVVDLTICLKESAFKYNEANNSLIHPASTPGLTAATECDSTKVYHVYEIQL